MCRRDVVMGGVKVVVVGGSWVEVQVLMKVRGGGHSHSPGQQGLEAGLRDARERDSVRWM